MPQVSFIVPLHNHLKHSQEMVTSLLATIPSELDFEIILIDDASSDDTADWLNGLKNPKVKCLINPHNIGYAGTNNRGVHKSIGEILCLLNNDLIFSVGWLEPMLVLLNTPELNAGLIGNVQRRVVDAAIDHAGVELNLNGQFEHIQQLPTDTRYSSISWVTGACVLIRRELFLALGGFDTSYHNGCEDIDLCFKVQDSGQSVYVSYESVIQHHVSLSRSKHSIQNEKNSRLLFSRWRNEIKQALAQNWTYKLQTDSVTSPWLDGKLSAEFMQTPYIASRIMAESRLLLQEEHWRHLLDQPSTQHGLQRQLSVYEVTPCTHGFRVKMREISLSFKQIKAISNFYLCGKVLPTLPSDKLSITISCNGLHSKQFEVKRGDSFNLGVEQPLLLPIETNNFYVSFDPCEQIEDEELFASLVLSHVMVDDHLFHLE